MSVTTAILQHLEQNFDQQFTPSSSEQLPPTFGELLSEELTELQIHLIRPIICCGDCGSPLDTDFYMNPQASDQLVISPEFCPICMEEKGFNNT